MSEAEGYVRAVLRWVPASFPDERRRIAADLRSHLEESVRAGEAEAGAVRRMGPPRNTAAALMAGVPLRDAPLAQRAAAYLVDQGLLATPVLAALAWVAAHRPGWLAALETPSGAGGAAAVLAVVLGAAALPFVYFPWLETRWGQTVGKRLFGLAVVHGEGTAVGWRSALVRRLPTLFEFMWLDALFAPFTARRQRAFDLVAGTVVVRAPRRPRPAAAWLVTALVAVLFAASVLAVARLARAAEAENRARALPLATS